MASKYNWQLITALNILYIYITSVPNVAGTSLHNAAIVRGKRYCTGYARSCRWSPPATSQQYQSSHIHTIVTKQENETNKKQNGNDRQQQRLDTTMSSSSSMTTINGNIVTSFVAGMVTMYLVKKMIDKKQAMKDRTNGKFS